MSTWGKRQGQWGKSWQERSTKLRSWNMDQGIRRDKISKYQPPSERDESENQATSQCRPSERFTGWRHSEPKKVGTRWESEKGRGERRGIESHWQNINPQLPPQPTSQTTYLPPSIAGHWSFILE